LLLTLGNGSGKTPRLVALQINVCGTVRTVVVTVAIVAVGSVAIAIAFSSRTSSAVATSLNATLKDCQTLNSNRWSRRRDWKVHLPEQGWIELTGG
jgi:hypothetical protein